MKEILCGTTDKEPPTEIVAQLAQELYNSGLLVTLIANLQLIDFEVGQHPFFHLLGLGVDNHIFLQSKFHCIQNCFPQAEESCCSRLVGVLKDKLIH